MTTYLGVDFADDKRNKAKMYLVAKTRNQAKRLEISKGTNKTSNQVELTAVDVPFGLPRSYVALLGGFPGFPGESYTDRISEVRVREIVGRFQSVTFAREKIAWYFHSSSHVRQTAAMSIIPGGIRHSFVLAEAPADPGARLDTLRAMRLGTAKVVEAHPRMFLYSLVERAWPGLRFNPNVQDILRAVRDYKKKGNTGRAGRKQLVQELPGIFKAVGFPTLSFQRGARLACEDSDHALDASLCAMTAWAHRAGLTWGWLDANIPEYVCALEGHMLILNPAPKP